jgi:hypothetical protein
MGEGRRGKVPNWQLPAVIIHAFHAQVAVALDRSLAVGKYFGDSLCAPAAAVPMDCG